MQSKSLKSEIKMLREELQLRDNEIKELKAINYGLKDAVDGWKADSYNLLAEITALETKMTRGKK